MKVSVVVPCYRSERTLPPLVQGLHEVLGAGADGLVDDYEIILVVDGSPDETFAVAHGLARESPKVRSLMLRRNYGQHNALLAGIRRAQHEVVVTMDDDLQHPPSELPTVLRPLDDPLVDLVYGVATTEEHGFLRSLASRSVKRGLALAGVPNANDVSALRAFRTDLREGFPDAADAFASVDVLLSWTTVSVQRAELRMDKRQEGASSYGFRKLVRHTFNMVTGYGTLPLTLVTYLGLLMGLVGAVLLVVTLWGYFTGSITVTGFTTLASMIALFSAAQMVSVGVLGEYIGRLHFRSMQKPTYVIRVDTHQPARPTVQRAEEVARALRDGGPTP